MTAKPIKTGPMYLRLNRKNLALKVSLFLNHSDKLENPSSRHVDFLNVAGPQINRKVPITRIKGTKLSEIIFQFVRVSVLKNAKYIGGRNKILAAMPVTICFVLSFISEI